LVEVYFDLRMNSLGGRKTGFRIRIGIGLALISLIGGVADASAAEPVQSRLVFAAYVGGQWDLYSIAADGSDLRQITNDRYEDRDPALAPDGAKLAFASRRERNWDLYIIDLVTGEEQRLTRHPAYDSAPAWSPDGTRIAFESYRAGDLDIWLLGLGSGRLENLTENTPEGDFGPAWSPDGHWLAFSSWRFGDQDLWLLDPVAGELRQLTQSPVAEAWPAWHPDGESLAFVGDDLGEREVYTLNALNPPLEGGAVTQVSWFGRTDGPVWMSDGAEIAAVFHQYDGQRLLGFTPNEVGRLPFWLTPVVAIQGRLTWGAEVVVSGQPLASLEVNRPSPLYVEDVNPSQSGNGEPYDLIRINDLQTGIPWLADTVDDSFQALRDRLREEIGYDFLGQVSETLRPINFESEASQYASWHKSGRAVDTLFDLNGVTSPGGGDYTGQRLEIRREEMGGETFWRMYLRCTDQSGRCGQPLRVKTWDWSYEARNIIAPDQGGVEKAPARTRGYYVDFTALAGEYGWERISSHEDEDYSWTWHFKAFEYWHYQKTLSGNNGQSEWYQAMLEVYPRQEVDAFFTWQLMRQTGEDPHLIALKGVPLPAQVGAWWSQIRP
jgi:TolB protein